MSSLALDGTLPRSRRTDPVTSVDAGRSVNLGQSQLAVLAVLRSLERAVSDRELVATAIGSGVTYTPQRIRSARAELVEAGLVERVEGVYRQGAHGRREQVWRLSDERKDEA